MCHKDIKEIKMNKNLFGEEDTPLEIYNFSKSNYTLEDLQGFIEKFKNRPECYALIGDAYRKLNDFENAIKSYTFAIRLNSINAAYYAIRAHTFLMQGSFYDSIKDFTYIIENKKLLNQFYYASRNGGLRLIAACCNGSWEIAKEDIEYILDDYVMYIKPVIGMIDKKRLLDSIENRKLLKIMSRSKI